MLSPDSKEEDLLLLLIGVKKEDRLTWEEFGNGDWDEIKDVCQKKWGLDSFQKIIKIIPPIEKLPSRQVNDLVICSPQ